MSNETASSGAALAAKKRSIARRFNDALAGRLPKAKSMDQRTAKKLERYREELSRASKPGNKPLSALEVAKRVHALLEAGERITDIRKLAKPREYDYDEESMVSLLAEMHAIYHFRPDAYRFAGVKNETLLAAGVISQIPKRRGPKKKSET